MVARPAEQVLSQIAGIEHTYSVARPGLAVLTLQFKVGVPRTEALVRLYDVLNANQDWLPRDLGTLPPIVKPKGIDDVPVVGVTLWSREALPASELERVAHAVESELKSVPGSREVRTIGGPGRAVHVWLDPVRLRERGVDVLSLKQSLSASNFAMPSGAVLDTDQGNHKRRRCSAWKPVSFCAPHRMWVTWWWASPRACRCTCVKWRGLKPVRSCRSVTCGLHRAARPPSLPRLRVARQRQTLQSSPAVSTRR
jgi:hypothetical protein